ncbi:MAG: hypothetical protein ACI86H_000872 [bacterium]
MRLKTFFLFFIPFLLFQSPAFAKAKVAGKVIKIRGGVFANGVTQSRNLFLGSRIRVGDFIITGKNSRMKMKLSDNTIITLGENSRFQITKYYYRPRKKQGNAFFNMVTGVFRVVTGKIGKLRGRPFKVKTPMAIIGIKGTDFWGGFWKNKKFDVALLKGKGVTIQNRFGNATITRVGYGVTLANKNSSPTKPKKWKSKKVRKAIRTISF